METLFLSLLKKNLEDTKGTIKKVEVEKNKQQKKKKKKPNLQNTTQRTKV